MSKKYYAVRQGRQTGIFTSWPQAQKQVNHYPNARFKSFRTKAEARNFVRGRHRHKDLHPSRSIVIYTDGGCRNHGTHKGQHVRRRDPAAWAFLVVIHGKRYVGTGYDQGATNNRMEMTALYQALKWLIRYHLNRKAIIEVADSRYLLDAITKRRLSSWRRHNWRLKSGRQVKNLDLWKPIYKILPKFKHITFRWTKGHANNQGNIFVDHRLNRTMNRVIKRNQRIRRVTELPPRPGLKAKSRTSSSSDFPQANDSVNNLRRGLIQLGLLKK